MSKILGKQVLSKEKLIELIRSAKQDENGHWCIVIPHDKYHTEEDPEQRVYFGMFYTVCEDFIEGFCYNEDNPEENTEHYNRHFIRDDTFQLWVAKDKIEPETDKSTLLKRIIDIEDLEEEIKMGTTNTPNKEIKVGAKIIMNEDGIAPKSRRGTSATIVKIDEEGIHIIYDADGVKDIIG